MERHGLLHQFIHGIGIVRVRRNKKVGLCRSFFWLTGHLFGTQKRPVPIRQLFFQSRVMDLNQGHDLVPEDIVGHAGLPDTAGRRGCKGSDDNCARCYSNTEDS